MINDLDENTYYMLSASCYFTYCELGADDQIYSLVKQMWFKFQAFLSFSHPLSLSLYLFFSPPPSLSLSFFLFL